MGNVLAAIDLVHAEHHAAVLKKAQKLAALESLPLSVVTVIPSFGMSIVANYFDSDIEKTALKRAAEDLHTAVKTVLGDGQDHQIQHIVRHGKVYEEILHTAKELDTSLIVLGAHRPNLQDYLLGQNAASIVRHAPCSVYILRE